MGVRAYFLTWTTYGSWLPGDARGWVDRHKGCAGTCDYYDPELQRYAQSQMLGEKVTLDPQRRIVAEAAIADACCQRGWTIHAVSVRSNHVHVVVSAMNVSPGEVMRVLKSAASRALNDKFGPESARWWTRQGSKRQLFTDKAMASAIEYVRTQDNR